MRVGVLGTSIGSSGQKGFYNDQEIGMAKELDKFFDEVIIYKAVSIENKAESSTVASCQHTILKTIPCKTNGINGIINVVILDATLDALIYFSDTQLMVPKVYHWCKKNQVRLLPYIGTIESHSTNILKQFVINTFFKRNLAIYTNCVCLAKTPVVKKALEAKGIGYCVVAPVGLDLSILHTNYAETSVVELKKKWGYKEKEKVLLFIGRLVKEKQPLHMINIFEKVYQKDSSYRLLLVGKGKLKDVVEQSLNEKKLDYVTRFVEQVPNSDIWELYRMADAFINLNYQEIFGMSILEAMYYECKVIAWHAPGPDLIIEDGVSGCLCNSDDEVIKALFYESIDGGRANKRICGSFTWKITADIINKVARGKMLI